LCAHACMAHVVTYIWGHIHANISLDAAGPETALKTQLNNSLVRCISPIVRFSLGVYGICYFSNGVCSDCFSHSQSLEQHWNKKGSTGGRKDTNVMRENQDAHQTVACPAKLVLPLVICVQADEEPCCIRPRVFGHLLSKSVLFCIQLKPFILLWVLKFFCNSFMRQIIIKVSLQQR